MISRSAWDRPSLPFLFNSCVRRSSLAKCQNFCELFRDASEEKCVLPSRRNSVVSKRSSNASMTEVCAICQQPLSQASLGGLCPRCVGRSALAGEFEGSERNQSQGQSGSKAGYLGD